MRDDRYPFLFAIPRSASKASREAAPGHIAKVYGVAGNVEHLRSDDRMHLYRIVEAS